MEFSIPQNIRSEYIKKDLLNRFSLKLDNSIKVTRIYYDSFDWRLYRKKLKLFSEASSEGRKLILCSFDRPESQRAMSIKEIPTFVSDFDSFIFQQKLAPVLDVRALLPQLTIQSKVTRLRYLNKDNKICLYINIENPRVILSDTHYRLIGKRIRLIPVKGYTKTCEQIFSYLKKKYTLIPAGQDEYSVGVRYLDNNPEMFRSRQYLKLKTDMTSSVALSRIFLWLLETMKINEEGIIKEIDTEFLHDFRVAVRKTRSLLGQIKHVFPVNIVENYVDEFSWLGSITGPVRDMHVYLQKYEHYKLSLPEQTRPQLEPLRNFLNRKRKSEHKELVENLQSTRYRKLMQNWRDFLTTPLKLTAEIYNAEKPLKQVANKQIWKLYRRILKQGSRISDNSPDEELHKLRIMGKKLRYLLEFYESIYSHSKMKRMIASIKKLQNILGDFNDYSVQIEALGHFEQQMADESVLSKDTRQAIDQLMDLLHQQQLEIRQQFRDRFIQFTDEGNQKMFKSLFKPDAIEGNKN